MNIEVVTPTFLNHKNIVVVLRNSNLFTWMMVKHYTKFDMQD